MIQNDKDPGVGPAGSVQTQRVEYESGKGCLMMVLVGIVLAAATACLIVLLSDPATVVSMG